MSSLDLVKLPDLPNTGGYQVGCSGCDVLSYRQVVDHESWFGVGSRRWREEGWHHANDHAMCVRPCQQHRNAAKCSHACDWCKQEQAS